MTLRTQDYEKIPLTEAPSMSQWFDSATKISGECYAPTKIPPSYSLCVVTLVTLWSNLVAQLCKLHCTVLLGISLNKVLFSFKDILPCFLDSILENTPQARCGHPGYSSVVPTAASGEGSSPYLPSILFVTPAMKSRGQGWLGTQPEVTVPKPVTSQAGKNFFLPDQQLLSLGTFVRSQQSGTVADFL